MRLTDETYKDYKKFYLGLKEGHNKAFHYLLSKIKGAIHAQCKANGITSKSDDVLQQTVAVLLKNLENGSYQFQENTSPATYAISIANKLILNHNRNRTSYSLDIDAFTNVLWTNSDWSELKQTVTYYLSLLGEDCRLLIRLRELEGYKYKEIIDEKRMPKYGSEGALRNKFQTCWETWMEIIERVKEHKK